jgi:hypothetical protein
MPALILDAAQIAKVYASIMPKLVRRGPEWRGQCPIHGGERDSFSVNPVTGQWMCHSACARGGSAANLIMERDGITFKDAAMQIEEITGMSRALSSPDRPKIVAQYDYTDEAGVLRYQALRYEPKTFKCRRPDGHGGVVWSLGNTQAIPYRLSDLVNSKSDVYIVEGEKDADNLATLGLTATTNHGGSEKWRPELTPWFTGKHVVMLPDNDEAGERHVKKVVGELSGVAASIAVVRLPGLPPKGDVSDWLAAGGTRADLERLVEDIRANQEPPKRERFKLYTPAELAALPPPTWLVDSHILEHSFAVVYGQSGGGKSFTVLDMALCIATGRPWADNVVQQGPVIYMSAEGASGLNERIKAWVVYNGWTGELTDINFVMEAPNLMDGNTVSQFINVIRSLPTPPVLVVLDTLARCVVGGDENSARDMGMAIAGADRIRLETGATVVLVHHTGKNSDSERGSGALRGAADTMILLKPEQGQITLSCEKQKDAAPFTSTVWHLVPVSATSSCVPVRVRDTPPPVAGKRSKGLGRHQRSLLDKLRHESRGLTLNELVTSTGIPKTTVHRHLASLIDSGHIVYNDDNKRYVAGFAAPFQSFHSVPSQHMEQPEPCSIPFHPPYRGGWNGIPERTMSHQEFEENDIA